MTEHTSAADRRLHKWILRIIGVCLLWGACRIAISDGDHRSGVSGLQVASVFQRGEEIRFASNVVEERLLRQGFRRAALIDESFDISPVRPLDLLLFAPIGAESTTWLRFTHTSPQWNTRREGEIEAEARRWLAARAESAKRRYPTPSSRAWVRGSVFTPDPLGIAFNVATLILIAIVLWMLVRLYRDFAAVIKDEVRIRERRCRTCGYPCRGRSCPECGADPDADNSDTRASV